MKWSKGKSRLYILGDVWVGLSSIIHRQYNKWHTFSFGFFLKAEKEVIIELVGVLVIVITHPHRSESWMWDENRNRS